MSNHLESDIREIVDQLDKGISRFSGATIFLCGGHGFLGRYYLALFEFLNREVFKKPCRLIVLDDGITSGTFTATGAAQDAYQSIHHNIVNPIEVHEPIDYMIHMAGIASPYYYRKYPLETLEVATVGTKNLLNLAMKHPPKGFLFFSSSEIYGDPDAKHVPTPESYRGNVACLGPRACYDESKRLGETLCEIYHQLHGIPVKIVRPFNIYGPGMQETDYRVLPNFASRIVGKRPLQIYGSGKQTRTFCYITDAIVGFTKALLDGIPAHAYNIGNPSPEISMLELAHLLQETVQDTIDIQLIEYPDSYPADEPQRRCPDIRKAAQQLKYIPQVTLPEGLNRFMGWAMQRYKGSQS